MRELENKQRRVSEPPENTRDRLGRRFIRLTDLRIDLAKIERGIAPEFQTTAMHYSGPVKEAINITNHELYNTFAQIDEIKDELLIGIVAHERGRLRDFFDTPLDDL